jgi:ATP-dependent helicase/nuclease subunit A
MDEPGGWRVSAQDGASGRQRRASDPAYSVWVGASAGTGKTKVLTDRVLNLLLQGTVPGRLLCLTFTKAAAAEMANRVIDRLEKWTVLGESDLIQDLTDLSGSAPNERQMVRARQLFGQVLDAPGGLKIYTVHAFCQSLLARFPLEAGVAPHFSVLDEAAATDLLRDVREGVLRGIRDTEHSGLSQALATLTSHVREDDFISLINVLIAERVRLRRFVQRAGTVFELAEKIRLLLGVKPSETVAAIEQTALDAIPKAALRAALPSLFGGKASEQKIAGRLAPLLDGLEPLSFTAYVGIYLTKEGTPYAKPVTKEFRAGNPIIAALIDDEAARITALMDRRRSVGVFEATSALLTLGTILLDEYEAAKRHRAWLDYDDLIAGVTDLLSRQGGVSWVHFKLDGGIDHILVDEAQDTNPEQWQVIRLIADEFFAGEGAVERIRTLFVVGDAKQSIFSFQRADPAEFIRMRDYFERRVRLANRRWEPVDLETSFRSTEAVLSVVDAVFAGMPARIGVSRDEAVRHIASRIGHGGVVELWPPAMPLDQEEVEDWAPPIKRTLTDHPRTRVAQLIAQQIDQWLKTGEPLESRGRPIRAGDILVLVRRRGPFVDELVRACKQLDVPIAGVDRMALTEQLAVMDLMALGRFVLLPEDDLNLACLLKSPLVGISEDQLYGIAHDRKGTVWQALLEAETGDAALTPMVDALRAWLSRADFTRPYEFFAQVLGPEKGRERLLGRLGWEAADPIDEFLAQALRYEQDHVPTLQGFLYWLDLGELEVKREGATGERDEVRIMTVHGAKGLQAPIVFLPDTMQVPRSRPILLWPNDDTGPLWSPSRDYDDAQVTSLRNRVADAEMEEYRRLLYVALTRAEDRLYVTGWGGTRAEPIDCWYRLVEQGMVQGVAIGAEPVAFDFGTLGFPDWIGSGWRSKTSQTAEPKPQQAVRGAGAGAALPLWARTKAPDEPKPSEPLTPSAPSEPPPTRSPLIADGASPFRRGRLIHRLLQSLPDLASDQRSATATRFLSSPVHDLSAADIEAIVAETLAVLDHPEFAALFQLGSRAEVPLIGRIGDQIVSGQIDRLAVTSDGVMIVDYKTNRPPPVDLAGVQPVYLRQMAAYRGLIRQIYPGLRVRCVLLWTDGPRLMELPDAVLEQAN